MRQFLFYELACLSVLVRNSQEQPQKAVGTAGASVTHLSGIADNVVEERKYVTYSSASGDICAVLLFTLVPALFPIF